MEMSMKKFMISVAAVCAMFFFVSCGGSSSESGEGTGDNEKNDSEEATDSETTDGEMTDEEATDSETFHLPFSGFYLFLARALEYIQSVGGAEQDILPDPVIAQRTVVLLNV